MNKKDKKFWDEFAKKRQKALLVLKSLKEDGCLWCRKTEKNFEDMAFHINSTHGFPREVLVEILKELDV